MWNETNKYGESQSMPTAEYGGGSVMLWALIFSKGGSFKSTGRHERL